MLYIRELPRHLYGWRWWLRWGHNETRQMYPTGTTSLVVTVPGTYPVGGFITLSNGKGVMRLYEIVSPR